MRRPRKTSEARKLEKFDDCQHDTCPWPPRDKHAVLQHATHLSSPKPASLQEMITSGSLCLVRISCRTAFKDMLNPTYASERPPCTQLYNQYNVSLLSTCARQLTTLHHLASRTWLFGFVSMCQDRVRRHHTEEASTNHLSTYMYCLIAPPAYLSTCFVWPESIFHCDDPIPGARGPEYSSFIRAGIVWIFATIFPTYAR